MRGRAPDFFILTKKQQYRRMIPVLLFYISQKIIAVAKQSVADMIPYGDKSV